MYQTSASNSCRQSPTQLPRPLDELLAFTEGEGGGVSSISMTANNTPKPGKKKKKTEKNHVRKILFPNFYVFCTGSSGADQSQLHEAERQDEA